MKEQLINRVLYCMQDIIKETELSELKIVLQNVLCTYRVESEKAELKVIDGGWTEDLEG